MARVLVTGATGFVGGHLVPRLLDDGHTVRCLVRDTSRLEAPWADAVEVVEGDVGSAQAVLRAADGCDAAYYLVHGLAGRVRGLTDREVALARSFADGVDLAGVRQVVYLGGLADDTEVIRLSEHLYARQQVGVTLRAGTVAVTELRAAIVVGAGSASFELLRAAARAPVVVSPPAALSRCQPIAVDDLVDALADVLLDADTHGQIIEVGGPDVLTYAEMVAVVRRELGWAPAREVPVPYLPPEAAATGGALLAHVDPALAYSLLTSARDDAVLRAADARVAPTPYVEAVRGALETSDVG